MTASLVSMFSGCGIHTLRRLNRRVRRGEVYRNDQRCSIEATVSEGDTVDISGTRYRVERVPGRERLMVVTLPSPPERFSGTYLVQCGYHKCLTEYFKRVFNLLTYTMPNKKAFRHFYHRDDVFYQECDQHWISSLSGHYVDPTRFEKIRISRVIRDPRDMLVSAYFYHKRSAEGWCDTVDPVDEDWRIVNGKVPDAIASGHSLASFLNAASIEEGLLAEIEFRQYHYASMLLWPDDNESIRTFRYEDIVGHETETFRELFEFYELGAIAKQIGVRLADRYSAGRKSGLKGHIRDASSAQWKRYFTPKVEQAFNSAYGDLLDRYRYR